MKTLMVLLLVAGIGFTQNLHAGVAVTPLTEVDCFAHDGIHGPIRINIHNYAQGGPIYIAVYHRHSGEHLFSREGRGNLSRHGVGHVNYVTPGGTPAGYQIWRNYWGALNARFHLNGAWSTNVLSCKRIH